MTPPLLEVKNIKRHFKTSAGASGGFFAPKKTVKAVDGVSFSVQPQECFAIVGESGCGKTTLGRLITGLEKPTDGSIVFEGRALNDLSGSEMRRARRHIQIIFQDPFSSLDPRMTVEEILSEPFIIHGVFKDAADRKKRLLELMDLCGIARNALPLHPHQFSGGQRQRIGIARALALNPKLIVADEPVSALDVSIQAQILNLLKDLQKELKLTYVFISHDLSVVRHLATRISVMYLGKMVELADPESLFLNPQHPYTEALLSAVPIPDPDLEKRRRRALLCGDVPSPIDPPSGCHFHPRCRYAVASCRIQPPPLEKVGASHWAACPVLPFAKSPSPAALRIK